MTQNSRLLRYLESHPAGITRLEAVRDLGVMNLWSRIAELERLGFVIGREDGFEVSNRYGEKCKVTRYWLISERAA